MGLLLVTVLAAGCTDQGPQERHPRLVIAMSQDVLVKIPSVAPIGPTYDRHSYRDFSVERNGYTGIVSLSAHAEPPLTLNFQQYSTADSTIRGRIGVGASVDAPAGTYRVTLNATQEDGATTSASFDVRIATFALPLLPPLLTVSQGATVTLTVAAIGTPPTDVQVTGAPAGVSVTSTTGTYGARYFDIAAASDAPTDTATLTVTASLGTSVETRQVRLAVQTPRPKRRVSFRICWALPFGTQLQGVQVSNDGEGWTTIIPDADGVFSLDATDRLRVKAVMSISGYMTSTLVRVLHLTASELADMQCANSLRGNETDVVSPSGVERWNVALGGARTSASTASSTSLYYVAPGAHDLVSLAKRAAATGGDYAGIIRRGVDYSPGDTVRLDFGGSEAFVLESAPHGFEPSGSAAKSVVSRLHTATTVAATPFAIPVEQVYRAVPESRLLPSDVQSLMVATMDAPTGPTRGVVQYFRSAQSFSPILGPAVASATVDTIARTFSLPSQPEYQDVAGVRHRKVLDGRGGYFDVELWQTKRYAGGTPAVWSFTMPDLGRALTLPPMDGTVPLSAAAGGPAILYFGGHPAAGTTLRWSSQMGHYLPFPTGL